MNRMVMVLLLELSLHCRYLVGLKAHGAELLKACPSR